MSVTFSITGQPTGEHVITCYEQGEVEVARADSYEGILVQREVHMALCGLDEGDDLCGSIDAVQFQGAVLLAMASDRDDSGVAAAVIGGREVGQAGATMIDCGLRPGYYGDRFAALHTLAAEAVRLDRKVQWS